MTFLFGLLFIVLLLSTIFLIVVFSIKFSSFLQLRNSYSGVTSPHGIHRLVKISIGGFLQYLHIKGQSDDSPLLLFLHGGPGAPNIGWFDEVQRQWENHFIVVQWDQRQTGKSYASMKEVGKTMSHQQLISDAEEVVQYLLKKFNQKKIILMGTSYGTYLGMHIVKRQPQWLYAYVAVGQVVNMMEHATEEHRLLLDYAIENNETVMIEKLKAMQPFPNPDNPSKSFFSNIYYLLDQQSKLGKCYPVGIKEMMRFINFSQVLSPLYSWRDIWNKYCGDSPAITYADYGFAEEFMSYDLPEEVGYDFNVPIFFFTGSNDWHVSSQITDRWFQLIKAPHKEHIWFQDSAHVPYITEPAEFAMALITRVLPFSKSKNTEILNTNGGVNEK